MAFYKKSSKNEQSLKTVPSYKQALKLLSPSEIRVLDEVEKGNTNAQIAENLQISIRTVHAHRRNICEKLQITGWLGLLKWLQKAKPTET